MAFEDRDYCTRKEIGYLIGEHHLSTWRTIQAEIDRLNLSAPCDRQIRYYLRKARQQPFDIQVCYRTLTDAYKQYFVYRARQEAA